MRFWFIIAMIVPASVVALAMIWLYFPLRSFRRDHPVLRDEEDLSAFRRLATGQMGVSLLMLRLIWVPLIVWLVGRFGVGELSYRDGLLYVLIPFLVQGLISSGAIGIARAVRSTPAASDALAIERDRVVDVWLHQKYPEW